jgi:hypothetical protein
VTEDDAIEREVTEDDAIEREFTRAHACARKRVRERSCVSRVRARTGVRAHNAKSSTFAQ